MIRYVGRRPTKHMDGWHRGTRGGAKQSYLLCCPFNYSVQGFTDKGWGSWQKQPHHVFTSASSTILTFQTPYLDDFAGAVQSSIEKGRLGCGGALHYRACHGVMMFGCVKGSNAKYLMLGHQLRQ